MSFPFYLAASFNFVLVTKHSDDTDGKELTVNGDVHNNWHTQKKANEQHKKPNFVNVLQKEFYLESIVSYFKRN